MEDGVIGVRDHHHFPHNRRHDDHIPDQPEANSLEDHAEQSDDDDLREHAWIHVLLARPLLPLPQSGDCYSVGQWGEMTRSVTMWIIILTIFTFGTTTYDMIHLLDIPLNCVYDTGAQSTKKRSIMATDGSPAAWFTG